VAEYNDDDDDDDDTVLLSLELKQLIRTASEPFNNCLKALQVKTIPFSTTPRYPLRPMMPSRRARDGTTGAFTGEWDLCWTEGGIKWGQRAREENHKITK
jgi:hypothetical protein